MPTDEEAAGQAAAIAAHIKATIIDPLIAKHVAERREYRPPGHMQIQRSVNEAMLRAAIRRHRRG